MQKYLKDFPLLKYDQKLMEIIREKQEVFQNRYDEDHASRRHAKSDLVLNLHTHILSLLDENIWASNDLLKNNQELLADEGLYNEWMELNLFYSRLYDTISNFNVLKDSISNFFESENWEYYNDTIEDILFNRIQKNDLRSWRQPERLIAFKDSSNDIKNSLILLELIDWKNGKKFQDTDKIIDKIQDNKKLIDIAIETAKSIENYKINNINEALRNVSNIFYNKDFDNIISQKPIGVWEIIKILWNHWFQLLLFLCKEFTSSSKWWLMLGFIFFFGLPGFFYIEWTTISMLLNTENSEILTQRVALIKDFSLLIISANIIISSFFGYVIVFCFGNYRKMEKINNEYRFRWIVTKSFWYLWQVANEEEKKILYPKMLDSIFKELPDDKNGNQESNISIPISEIVKNSWNSQK